MMAMAGRVRYVALTCVQNQYIRAGHPCSIAHKRRNGANLRECMVRRAAARETFEEESQSAANVSGFVEDQGRTVAQLPSGALNECEIH
jgi:hypothetical protein